MIRAALLPTLVPAILFATPAAAQNRTEAILDEARATCEALDAGTLEVGEQAITAADLDGDGAADDRVVDFNHVQCQWNGSQWHGTGGAPLHFVIDDTRSASWWGHTWKTVDFDGVRVILLSRHGSLCDDYGAAPCIQAIVVAPNGFETVRAPESEEELTE